MPAASFKDMSDIIAFAVEREEEAARGYGDMMFRAKTESLRLLQNISSSEVAALKAVKAPDLRISDFLVEAPLNAEMSLQDLLIFAAKKEQKAVEFYSRLLALASTGDQKTLFEFLISQERQHKLKLETEYENRVLWEN